MNDMTAYDRLTSWFTDHGRALVAFSGGVDSTLLAKAAHDALGDKALALTAVSASLAPRELDEAKELAVQIGIRHLLLSSNETSQPSYLVNDGDRCYHCKTELYRICSTVAKDEGFDLIVNGLNTDDLGDHRPGSRAADEFGVRSPFVELGMNKKVIRQLSADRGLPTAEKPEMACLASRFPTGTPITITGLGRVATAEALIASLGFSQYRVRFHDDLARIEIPPDEISHALEPTVRKTIIDGLKAAGFRWVTIDLDGYTRGSSNAIAMAREV